MDISTLREFVVLSDTLNYSATARFFYISQPVLTKHIQSLEKEIGAKLFVRSTHSVQLTSEGKVFAKRMKAVLEDFDASLVELAKLREQVSSTLRIAQIETTTGITFASACALFKERCPKTTVDVSLMEPEAVVSAVRTGKIDFGITMLFEETLPQDVEFSTLVIEPFGALLRRGHPITKRKGDISMRDFKGMKVLIPNPVRFPAMSRMTSNVIRNVAPDMTVVDTMNDIGSIAPFLLSENGVALTFGNVSRYYRDNFEFVYLTDIKGYAAVGALWKKSQQADLQEAFLDCLKAAIDKHNGFL